MLGVQMEHPDLGGIVGGLLLSCRALLLLSWARSPDFISGVEVELSGRGLV